MTPPPPADESTTAPGMSLPRFDELDELLNLRGTITRLSKQLHRQSSEAEDDRVRLQKGLRELLALAVGFVDDLRRAVAGAKRAAENESPASETKSSGWLSRWLGGRDSPGAAHSDDWFRVIDLLSSASIQSLEDRGVVLVPLCGQDLRTLEFEGESVKRWVTVQNKIEREELIVTEEIRGLWIGRQDDRMYPVQRGEVVVR